ncbi:MAG: hypothetical protein K2K56_05755 [Lachnospiraceae bacterium]|nr:hypothetical protein [Lachnospiraceae bacterium]
MKSGKMELVKGEKINYKLFNIVLSIIVFGMAGFVFCVTAYIQVKDIYYCNNGVKNTAFKYRENSRLMLEYTVDGKKYLNDISDDITNETSFEETEEIYYLKQQPEKFYRTAYKEDIAFGYIFIGVLLIIRFILLVIAKHMPTYIFYGKSISFEKEIISFRKKKKK